MDITSQGTLVSSGNESVTSKWTASLLEEKEREVAKDNVGSPLDVECSIQEERITKILDTALYKTKVAICLPKLVTEYHTLSSIVTEHHMEDLIYIFEHYDDPLYSQSLINVSMIMEMKEGEFSLKNRLNPELAHMMYILCSYSGLKGIVEEMIKKMKEEYSNSTDPIPALEYLATLERFRELMVKQMHTNAEEELTEKHLSKTLERFNQKLLDKIKALTNKLESEQASFDQTMGIKQETIRTLEKELEEIQTVAAAKIKDQVLKSNIEMVKMSREHDIRNESLKLLEQEAQEEYTRILNSHLAYEKKQRLRRLRVETQLLTWVQKYDTEMTQMQFDLDELNRNTQEEERMCDELTVRLAEQEVEYIPLMKEREDEYQEEMAKKMEQFRREHAARVIQTCWKKVLALRAEKKKLKAELKVLIKQRKKQKKLDAQMLKERNMVLKKERIEVVKKLKKK